MVDMDQTSVYNEDFFYGEEKKKGLTYFPGKIKTTKDQTSGNLIVTLVNKKGDKLVTKDVIFKKIEIDSYHLDGILKEGNVISVYGISTKRNSIFPACIVKTKKDEEIETIEIQENRVQYEMILSKQGKGEQQTALDKWKK